MFVVVACGGVVAVASVHVDDDAIVFAIAGGIVGAGVGAVSVVDEK